VICTQVIVVVPKGYCHLEYMVLASQPVSLDLAGSFRDIHPLTFRPNTANRVSVTSHSKTHLYLHWCTHCIVRPRLRLSFDYRSPSAIRAAVNMSLKHLLGLASVVLTAKAQSSSTAAACPSSIAPAQGAPSVAPGFRVQVVANNLQDPRSLQFDSAGGLLVVEHQPFAAQRRRCLRTADRLQAGSG
jgi:hypothetical protein